MPASIEGAVANAAGLEELERIMVVCATRPREELEQRLGLRVY